MTDTATTQRSFGIIIDHDGGRTIEDTDKGPVTIWNACLLPVGRFDRHGDTGYVVDAISSINPDKILRGLVMMAGDCISNRFLGWCSQNGLPQPDGKNVRKIINGMIADNQSLEPVTYVDGVGEIEQGLWSLANGVMDEGAFIPMERGAHRSTPSGRKVVYAPSIGCDESCGNTGISEDSDKAGVVNWVTDMIGTFGSVAPLIVASWVRASVFRSKIEVMDAQVPAIYVCGDSHRGKTLMATVSLRMLGARGERPHANMTSSSNAGVFLVAASRSSLPFVMDEVKPYSGINDNDLVKSLVNGDIPAKSTRSGRLRTSVRVKSMPMLISEFAPGDTSSLTNRLFTVNLVSLSALAKTSRIPGWVWWNDKHQSLYEKWAHTIYAGSSTMDQESFVAFWKLCAEDAQVICDEAQMTLNRSVTATTIALIGFRMMNEDCGGKLMHLYQPFCEGLSVCLREMSRLVAEVSPMGRFITSLKSGWSSMEGRYSKFVCDRVFSYSNKYGFVVDHATLHGLLLDSRRIDASRLGNPATVAMILEGEGFKQIKDDKLMRGRHALSMSAFLDKSWSYDMSRLTDLMDCACGKYLSNTVDLNP